MLSRILKNWYMIYQFIFIFNPRCYQGSIDWSGIWYYSLNYIFNNTTVYQGSWRSGIWHLVYVNIQYINCYQGSWTTGLSYIVYVVNIPLLNINYINYISYTTSSTSLITSIVEYKLHKLYIIYYFLNILDNIHCWI